MYVSQVKYFQNVDRLVRKVRSNKLGLDGSVDLIVSIAVGGVILGSLLMDRVRAPMLFVRVSSYEGKRQVHKPEVKELPSTLVEWLGKPEVKNILLVDDLVDTGDTMDVVAREIGVKLSKEQRLVSLVMFAKSQALERGLAVAYLEETPSDEWIEFFYD